MRTLILLILISTVAFAQQKGTFTDPRDKKAYKTVKIGEQTWMAENLNFEAKGSICYGNLPENCKTYGRLYNWETAKTACPSGWHLPTNEEWQTLVDFAGGEDVAGKRLKATSGWITDSGYKASTDEFGFTALPGGVGYSDDGSFKDVGFYGYWWSSSIYERNSGFAYGRSMLYYGEYVVTTNYNNTNLFSVRCVKN